jgi:hypothetical protein
MFTTARHVSEIPLIMNYTKVLFSSKIGSTIWKAFMIRDRKIYRIRRKNNERK